MWFVIVGFSTLFAHSFAACKGGTTYNIGKEACERKLLFEDDFNTKDVHTRWRHTIRFSDYPDYEFNMYDRVKTNVSSGIIYLQPTLLSESKGEDFIFKGDYDLNEYPPKPARCTLRPDSGLCRKNAYGYNIINPIVAPRLTSKFRFRYGTVEIRAKVPKGDWIYPEIELAPPTSASRYGKNSARVLIAMVRGNEILKMPGADQRLNFGTTWLEAGVYAGTYDPLKAASMVALFNETPWSADFHTYKLEWEPGQLKFFVDNEPIGVGVIKTSGLLQNPKSSDAPVDEELEVVIGVGVGGVQRFPDRIESDGKQKPWKNKSPKAMLKFWQAKDDWLSTWNGIETSLQIDYVKVWSRDTQMKN